MHWSALTSTADILTPVRKKKKKKNLLPTIKDVEPFPTISYQSIRKKDATLSLAPYYIFAKFKEERERKP